MARKANFGDKERRKIKKALVVLLEEMPIKQVACKKAGITRMTFDRWYKKDTRFAKAVDEAMRTSRGIINDLGESKLIEGMQRGEKWATTYWLSHNCDTYAPAHRYREQRREAAETAAHAVVDSLQQIHKMGTHIVIRPPKEAWPTPPADPDEAASQ